MPIRKLYKSERFLRVIFGACLFVVLCMGGLAYKYIHDLSGSFRWVEHTYEVHLELENTLLLLKDAETVERNFLVSKDSTYFEPYASIQHDLDQSLKRLRNLVSDNPVQIENTKELKLKIEKRLAALNTTAEFVRNGTFDTPEFTTSFKQSGQLMQSVRFKINEMIAHEKALLDVRRSRSTESLFNAPLVVYYVLILSLVLLLLTYGQISTNLKKLRSKNELLETYKESTTQSELVSKHGNWIWHIEDDSFEFSDNLYRLLGEAPQSFESTMANFMEFVHPEDLDRLKEQVSKMIEEEDLPFIYYRIIQKNGAIKHFKAYGKVLISTAGDRRLLGTIADITDEIKNFRLVEERNLELERNNKELASFNYVASHDLQEPLRKIQTFISRLETKESENFSENGKLYVERIKSASARMRSLIDDLLQFSRTNKSEQSLEISNMNMLLQSAKQDLVEIINKKKAKITSDAIPPMRVIPFQIQQLFQNLISNSLKYSREGVETKIHIAYSKVSAKEIPEIKSTTYKNYHNLTISDNGIGFDKEYSEKIFVLFNRLHNKNEYTGTGIGLSICKKIVENHYGYILAEGDKEKGATFKIYLPFT